MGDAASYRRKSEAWLPDVSPVLFSAAPRGDALDDILLTVPQLREDAPCPKARRMSHGTAVPWPSTSRTASDLPRVGEHELGDGLDLLQGRMAVSSNPAATSGATPITPHGRRCRFCSSAWALAQADARPWDRAPTTLAQQEPGLSSAAQRESRYRRSSAGFQARRRDARKGHKTVDDAETWRQVLPHPQNHDGKDAAAPVSGGFKYR